MLQRVSFVAAALAVAAALSGSPAGATGAVVTVRGGDVLYGSGGAACRVGFNAHDSTARFGLMSRRCVTPGSTWYRDAALTQPVGTGDGFGGGENLLRYFDTVSAPSVVVAGGTAYPVTGARTPAVGARLCTPGLTTGLRCGTVVSLNGTLSVDGDIVSGLVQAGVTAEPGLGGPAFDGGTALGVTPVPQNTPGTTYFQPVTQLLNAYGLTIG